ncbi:glycosyltransferase [Roseinatronobacter sp.]
MADRFANSASKRNPLRSLPLSDDSQNASGKFARSSSLNLNVTQIGDANKETVLVASHAASLTGAPILALNIAQSLAKKYNIVVVTLGKGELSNEFISTSVATYEFSQRNIAPSKILDIARKHNIKYALVNSVESRSLIPSLKQAGIPIVALLHEFASYTRPSTAFADVLNDADHVIFSTRVTLENALEQYGLSHGTKISILPQGKCVVPRGSLSEDLRAQERSWLDTVLRPNDEYGRDFVVIGVGTIEPRKSVDLFLECATRVITSPGGGRFRFVWIGNGYDPDKDTSISAYLADQIKRAGIQSQVSIVRPTNEIEHAYKAADLLLLSSRLDPLPNVAIDALTVGTPVLCFERTTGIADFLFDSGLGEYCVAPYLDTSDMAKKILDIATKEELRIDISNRIKSAALECFNFKSYVEKLDAIASNIRAFDQRISEDIKYIKSSGLFREDFFCPSNHAPTDNDEAIQQYISACMSGERMRKPAPEFNPSIYNAQQRCIGVDPYVHFLRQGAPIGPWRFQVIDQNSAVDLKNTKKLRAAIHVHVTEPRELALFTKRLQQSYSRPDIFVSTIEPNGDDVRAALEHLPWPANELRIVPNRGGALGALLSEFASVLVKNYDVVGQFHHADWQWQSFASTDIVLENLVGGEFGGAMIDRIFTAFSEDQKLSLVYPADPDILGWGSSRASADRLSNQLGITRLPDQIDFPTSGMFWVRSNILGRFLELNLNWEDYAAGDLDAEGSIVEALPRLFGILPQFDKLTSAVTNVRGKTW